MLAVREEFRFRLCANSDATSFPSRTGEGEKMRQPGHEAGSDDRVKAVSKWYQVKKRT